MSRMGFAHRVAAPSASLTWRVRPDAQSFLWGRGESWDGMDTPPPNFDLVILIGPGVIIGLVAVLIAYLKWRQPPRPPRE